MKSPRRAGFLASHPCTIPLLASALLLGLWVVPSIAETAKINAGTLTCTGNGTVGLILGSQEILSCTYVPADKSPSRSLKGTISNIGLDIGVKGKSTMIWTVLGSTTALPDSALRGQFVGASADASLGIGGGAKVLIGGNNKSIVLQPLSVQGQTGINLAVGVSGLKLEAK